MTPSSVLINQDSLKMFFSLGFIVYVFKYKIQFVPHIKLEWN